MACDCISVMDEHLAKHNTRLQLTLLIDHTASKGKPTATLVGRPHLSSEKINKKLRECVTPIATFCPFCGVRYEPEPTDG